MSAPVHPAHVHCVAEGYRLSPEIGEPETLGLLRHTGDVGGSQWDLSCTDATSRQIKQNRERTARGGPFYNEHGNAKRRQWVEGTLRNRKRFYF